MKFRNLLFIGLLMFVFSCASDSISDENIGYRNIELLNSLESVQKIVPTLKEAPTHVSASRGAGFVEFFSMNEPAVTIEGTKFNPSSFFIFNDLQELVAFSIFYVCEVPKSDFKLEEMINKLNNNQIKGLKELSEAEGMKMELSNEVKKELIVDMESARFPVIKYKVRFISE